MRRVLAAVIAAMIALFAAAPGFAQEKLVVWWPKGFYRAEDEALLAVIRKYEAATGVKVELSQVDAQDMIARSTAALDAGAPPDVAYADDFDLKVAGKWAFDDRLEDISDVIEPIKDRFLPVAIGTARLRNGRTGKRAYYGFALKQQMLHIQYWKDILAIAGFKENDIPNAWKEYWSFWCDRVQPAYRRATGGQVYGVGLPMGVASTDSYESFLTWIDAYDVKLVDESGKVLVDEPKVRQGLIRALKDYTDIQAKGCSPPTATGWTNAGNDLAFDDRTVALTLNPGIAIATRWLDEANNLQLPAARRAAGRKAYDELIATAGFPDRVDGSVMVPRVSVKLGVIFREARNKGRAREFVKLLLEEENLRPYVEGAFGLWFPVTRAGQESVFWQSDRQRKAVYDLFKAGTRPYEFTRNYRFATLDTENVWARAMIRVVNDKVPVDRAVDEMIARIREVTR